MTFIIKASILPCQFHFPENLGFALLIISFRLSQKESKNWGYIQRRILWVAVIHSDWVRKLPGSWMNEGPEKMDWGKDFDHRWPKRQLRYHVLKPNSWEIIFISNEQINAMEKMSILFITFSKIISVTWISISIKCKKNKPDPTNLSPPVLNAK